MLNDILLQLFACSSTLCFTCAQDSVIGTGALLRFSRSRVKAPLAMVAEASATATTPSASCTLAKMYRGPLHSSMKAAKPTWRPASKQQSCRLLHDLLSQNIYLAGMQLLYAQLPANVTTGLVECIVTACHTTQLDPILISTGDNDSCASSMSLKKSREKICMQLLWWIMAQFTYDNEVCWQPEGNRQTLPCMTTAAACTWASAAFISMLHNVVEQTTAVMHAPRGMQREASASIFSVWIESSCRKPQGMRQCLPM